MNIPYRTRLKIQRTGTVALFVLTVLVLVWFCWVVWLERYVIYTREGATIDFTISGEQLSGIPATSKQDTTKFGTATVTVEQTQTPSGSDQTEQTQPSQTTAPATTGGDTTEPGSESSPVLWILIGVVVVMGAVIVVLLMKKNKK